MKSTLMKSLICASLIILAAGCGKKGGGGGNNTPVDPYANYYNQYPGNMYGNQQALDALRAWYAQPESANLGLAGTFVKKTESMNSFKFYGSFCFFGKGYNCDQPQPTHCYQLNPSTQSYDVGTPSGSNVSQCTINQPGLTKANNPNIAAIMNPQGYQMSVQQQGQYFIVVHSAMNQEIRYIIDTSRHSAINPVQVEMYNGTSGTRQTIDYVQGYGY